MWQSFRNVGVFLVINVPLTVVLSLLLATALNKIVHARTFFRVSYYVPYVTASVAVVAVWLFLFSQQRPREQHPRSARARAVVAGELGARHADDRALRHVEGPGFYILLYLSALQNVPKELYESVSMDGGGKIRSSSP